MTKCCVIDQDVDFEPEEVTGKLLHLHFIREIDDSAINAGRTPIKKLRLQLFQERFPSGDEQ